jgi:hypothetical protein
MTRLAVLLLLLAPSTPTAFAQEKSVQGPELLRKLESDFARAVAERGHDAFVSYFADDGLELEDGGGVKTKVEMRQEPAWAADLSLSWAPVKAEMASSGDMDTPTAITCTSPKIKPVSWSRVMESTHPSGKSSRTAHGRWFLTWAIPVPRQ